MPLRAPSKPLLTQADWDRYTRSVPVEPDPNSVDNDQLKNGAVTTPKLADNAVSTIKVADDAITDAKLRDSNALSVIGRSADTNGSPADIAAVATNTFLVRRGTQLVFDPLVDADIPATLARDSEVTSAANAAQAAAEATAAAALTAHEGAANPHPTYLTQAEADALYQPLAAVLSMLHTGTGSPESVVTATVGHLYLRDDGGANTTLYVKESGSGNTGWVAK